MKKIILFVKLYAVLVIFQSCSKENISVPGYPINGLWVGTYNIEQAAENGDSFYYSFLIRKDDSIQVQSQGADGNTYYGIGSWTLNDSAFNADITTTNLGQQGALQHVTAIYDNKKGIIKEGRIESAGGFFVASFRLSRIN